jgi:hypothetical protein
MKNKLSDLNDHLFEAIEWLSDRDVKGEDLKQEIARDELIKERTNGLTRRSNDD